MAALRLLNHTFATPAENLACDEALLDVCEAGGGETLRFWESPVPFVVVGYGNRIASEVNVEECRRRGVPILRRCSGGGTVVQGPGCWNYNLVLRIPESGPLTTVTGTNDFVMERHRAALEELLGVAVSVQGHTDLAFAPALDLAPDLNPAWPRTGEMKSKSKKDGAGERWLKFSGNAQRRRRRALVFHGTILHGFDLTLVDALLHFPSAQPDYRASRSHRDFVRNIPAAPESIRAALAAAWGATEAGVEIPRAAIEHLVGEQYGRAAWNLRR
jgi:lipoate---protein ligase